MAKLAAVVIDTRKLAIFKRHLDAAGYKYDQPGAFSNDTLLLRVEYEWAHKLKPILEAAHRECDEKKKETN